MSRYLERAQHTARLLDVTLDYGQIDEVTADELSSLLGSIQAQCAQIHADVHQTYIAYPVDEKLAVLP